MPCGDAAEVGARHNRAPAAPPRSARGSGRRSSGRARSRHSAGTAYYFQLVSATPPYRNIAYLEASHAAVKKPVQCRRIPGQRMRTWTWWLRAFGGVPKPCSWLHGKERERGGLEPKKG